MFYGKQQKKFREDYGFTQKEYLQIWNNDINKEVTEVKKIASRGWLNAKSVQDETNYKSLLAIAQKIK